ncbi:MAG: thiamine pyrophosphate-dependent enzyme [Halodesulfurarchaeum sp.]
MSTDIPEPETEISHDDDLFNPGHRACAGCGPALAMKFITEATGEDTIIAHATGCMEVVSSPWPESAWGVSWIHNIFENAASVAGGVEAAYRAFDNKDIEGYMDHDDVNFVAIGGDGATFDIGIRALSGMFDRGHDVLYIAYDNEAYMNTGIQRSSATPPGAATTTSPAGEESFGEDRPKKDMPAIARDHGVPYVATASIAKPTDFKNKIQKALEIDGPKYIQVHSPCMLGWNFDPKDTVNVANLAIDTGVQPLFEYVDGELEDVLQISDRTPVEEYLKAQGRFKHLQKKEGGEDVMQEIQEFVDERAEDMGLDR